MKFRISRASDWSGEKCPVDGAWLEVREVTESRPWGSDSQAMSALLWDRFTAEGGRNHRKVERSGLQSAVVDYEREEDCREWFIDIETLDDLMALRRRVGDGLIINDDPSDERPTVLIHDTYIE